MKLRQSFCVFLLQAVRNNLFLIVRLGSSSNTLQYMQINADQCRYLCGLTEAPRCLEAYAALSLCQNELHRPVSCCSRKVCTFHSAVGL